MKIAKDVRKLHAHGEALYRRLGDDVQARLRPRLEARRWFFEGRVKQLESFALKLETGRVTDPARLDDFYACTIIVRTVAEIAEAEELVKSIYEVRVRKPEIDAETYKAPSNFQFDDLRLYVVQPESTTGRDEDLDGLLFEIQVKTILQHAWGVATHDLIYKSDSVSWPLERIAYQVKASLEHAEIAIAEANALATTPAIAKSDRFSAELSKIIDIVGSIWDEDHLPADRKRLASSILEVLRLCRLGPSQFPALIEQERTRIGVLPLDLSPYAFTVQAIANNSDIDLKAFLSHNRNRAHLFVHDGMELPAWMAAPHNKIIRPSTE